jgi:hypothetical protein
MGILAIDARASRAYDRSLEPDATTWLGRISREII